MHYVGDDTVSAVISLHPTLLTTRCLQVHAAKLLQHNSNLSSVSLVAKPISHTSLGSTFTVFPKQVYFVDDFPYIVSSTLHRLPMCLLLFTAALSNCDALHIHSLKHFVVSCFTKRNPHIKIGNNINSMYSTFEQIHTRI